MFTYILAPVVDTKRLSLEWKRFFLVIICYNSGNHCERTHNCDCRYQYVSSADAVSLRTFCKKCRCSIDDHKYDRDDHNHQCRDCIDTRVDTFTHRIHHDT